MYVHIGFQRVGVWLQVKLDFMIGGCDGNLLAKFQTSSFLFGEMRPDFTYIL